MNFLDKYSIKRLETFAAGIVISLSVIFILVLVDYIFFEKSQRERTISFYNYIGNFSKLKKASNTFINQERAQIYYETGFDPVLTQINGLIQNSTKSFEKTELIAEEFDLTLVQDFRQTLLGLKEFEKNLNTISKIISELGNYQFGLLRDARIAGDIADNELKKAKIPGITELPESFRKIEKSVEQRQDIPVTNDLEAEIERFEKILEAEADTSGKTARSAAYFSFIEYRKALRKLHEEYAKIRTHSQYNAVTRNDILLSNAENLFPLIETRFHKTIDRQNERKSLIALFFLIIYLILISLVIGIFVRYINKKIRETNAISETLTGAYAQNELESASQNEFTLINERLSRHILRLNNSASAINQLAQFETNFEFNEKNADDILSKSIVQLQLNLAEKEKKEQLTRIEKAVQDRHVSGLAEFGGILRRNTDRPEIMAYEIVSKLVRFLEADVCGIYFLSADKKLVLMAAYAFNERKYFEKIIEPGEGLVGTCARERTSFYFDKMPDDYIQIISGFGSAKPTNLLICPLFLNENTFGVIETASLKEFSKADIRFVEALGEDIASTLLFMKVRDLTAEELKIRAQKFLEEGISHKR